MGRGESSDIGALLSSAAGVRAEPRPPITRTEDERGVVWMLDDHTKKPRSVDDEPAVIVPEGAQVLVGEDEETGSKGVHIFGPARVWCDERGQAHRDGDLPAVISGDWEAVAHLPEDPVEFAEMWWGLSEDERDELGELVEDADASKIWCQRGAYHRDGDLPALVNVGDSATWFQKDLRHRDGGRPAEIFADGSLKWFREGLAHRDGDEPALVTFDDNGSITDQTYYRNGLLHRDGDEPAWDEPDMQIWAREGRAHREGDQPAVVTYDADSSEVHTQTYYVDGWIHREGGPAIEVAEGVSHHLNIEGDETLTVEGPLQIWCEQGIVTGIDGGGSAQIQNYQGPPRQIVGKARFPRWKVSENRA